MKTVNQVHETNDYSIFKSLTGNRIVNKLHVRRLTESFKSDYLLSPIIVNHNYEIIDGQHRYEAAKSLGLPISFIVCNDYGLKEVQILNTNSKNWKREDYLKAYCDMGYPEYLKFREFATNYPDFGMNACVAILTNKLGVSQRSEIKDLKGVINKSGSYMVKFFEEGDLVIPDYEQSIENAEKILMIKPYYEGFNRSVFVIAMLGILRVEDYSHSKLLDKLKAQPTALQHCANVTQYKLLIEDVYNFRSREKISLRY